MQRTFSFIDIAGFTVLTEAHGAETAADVVGRFTALVQRAIDPPGRLVDRVGDAAFVVTPRPDDAIAFLQRLFALAASEPYFPALRVGLHHGDAFEREGSYYGTSVNVAARIVAQARGSEVLATGMIAAVAKRQGIDTESRGTHTLRKLRKPIEFFALNLRSSALLEVIDPVCRMKVNPNTASGSIRLMGQTHWFCSRHCLTQFTADSECFIRP